MVSHVIFGKEKLEDIAWARIGNGALLNKLVTPLRIWVSDVAGYGEDSLALLESVGGSIKRAGAFGGFNDYDDVR